MGNSNSSRNEQLWRKKKRYYDKIASEVEPPNESFDSYHQQARSLSKMHNNEPRDTFGSNQSEDFVESSSPNHRRTIIENPSCWSR